MGHFIALAPNNDGDGLVVGRLELKFEDLADAIRRLHKISTSTLCRSYKVSGSEWTDEFPINIPAKNTSAPPSITCTVAESQGVSIYLCRMVLITPSSITTTIMAMVQASRKS